MQPSFVEFLLVFILCISTWSCIKAENKVTVTDFKVEVVSGNGVIDSWNPELGNNLLASTINIDKNCPGAVQIDIRILKDDQIVNTMAQSMKQPIKDFESYNMCASIDAPETDDESCSISQGEQTAKDCDISSWFSDMDAGSYTVECDFKVENELTATVYLYINVESE